MKKMGNGQETEADVLCMWEKVSRDDTERETHKVEAGAAKCV